MSQMIEIMSEGISKLTPKQATFVAEYLVDLNATQAAIRSGYSEKTAYSQGQRLLKNVEVQGAITKAQVTRSANTGINSEWVLTRLASEATADLADLYDANGAIKPIHAWPLIWRQGLVAGIKHQEIKDSEGNATGDYVVEVKLSDRIKRIELIGKHVDVQAFKDQVDMKAAFTVTISGDDADL